MIRNRAVRNYLMFSMTLSIQNEKDTIENEKDTIENEKNTIENEKDAD